MRSNACKFYNGSWHNEQCEAGVSYRDVTPNPDDDRGIVYRLPCMIRGPEAMNPGQAENYALRGSCPKFQLPTQAEIDADDAETDARLKEVLESLAKGVVPDGVIICGPSHIGKCKCNCPESCEHIWDGQRVEDEEVDTATCSKCGDWQMNHDMWIGD